MTFKIRWSRQAQRFVEKLPAQEAHRIAKKIDSIKECPFHFLQRYIGENFYKLRIGKYRVLIDVDSGQEILFVGAVGLRKNIYKI